MLMQPPIIYRRPKGIKAYIEIEDNEKDNKKMITDFDKALNPYIYKNIYVYSMRLGDWKFHFDFIKFFS